MKFWLLAWSSNLSPFSMSAPCTVSISSSHLSATQRWPVGWVWGGGCLGCLRRLGGSSLGCLGRLGWGVLLDV